MDPTALGRYLRESREAKELTLEDAVRALRIRRDILESFEQGEFNVMDSSVRVRGMLRNYAHYLGLEEERVLQYYESATNTRRRRFGRRDTQHVEPVAPRSITDTPPSLPAVPQAGQSGIADILRIIAMVLVSLAAIAVIIFVIVDRLDINMPGEPDVIDAATVPAGSVTVTPTNTPSITPRATVITDTPVPEQNFFGIIEVFVEMQQRSWVRIVVDDAEQYAGILEPGYSATYTGSNTVRITAANAAALDILYNGVEQDTFGARGQQVELVFTATGVEVMSEQGAAQITATEQSPATIESTVATPIQPESTAIPAENTIVPTATPIVSGVSTPTPLFPVSGESSSDVAGSAVVDDEAAVESTSASTVQATATEIVQDVATATATDTLTPAVLLPVRETSIPTATKTG